MHGVEYIIYELGYRVNEIIMFSSKLSPQSKWRGENVSDWRVLTNTHTHTQLLNSPFDKIEMEIIFHSMQFLMSVQVHCARAN